MTALLSRLIAALAFVSAAAQAAPLSPDVTGYWYNPSESGWGAAIAQQGEVLFVTLFVYDEQKRPAWFVASSVTAAGNGVFGGTLYRTSGPAFGGPFDSRLVDAQAVGTVSLQYGDGGGETMLLSYFLNGVTVTKALVRQAWGSDATRLVGAYFGGINFSPAAVTQPAGCPATPTFLPPGGALRITMADPSTIAIIGSEGIDTETFVGGIHIQTGQVAIITGSVFSGQFVSPLRIADATVTNLVVTDDGFLGHLRMVRDGSCLYEGSIGGVRRR
jgi:hypothetical protein